MLSILTTVGPPITIGTALLIYFGWARSNSQAQYMGLDVSLFGYSTQDYILRGTSTLYLPLLAASGGGIAWLLIHRRVVVSLTGSAKSRGKVGRIGRVLLISGTSLVVVAILFLATIRTVSSSVFGPISLTLGIIVAAYGSWLIRAATAGYREILTAPQRIMRTLFIGTAITMTLFWELGNYAGVVGRGNADSIASNLEELPQIVLVSHDPLSIETQGVREVRVSGVESSIPATVRYKMTGLRFLDRSGGRLFLLPDGWRPGSGVVIVLPDDGATYWEFSK